MGRLFAFVALATISINAEAGFLDRFKANPAEAIHAPVEKFQPQNKNFVRQKLDACRRDETRELLMRSASLGAQSSSPLRSLGLEPMGRERVEDFLEVEYIERNVFKMHNEMRRAEVSVTPWSGDYWAIRYGGAAKRYADPNFPAMETWKDAFDYVVAQHPARTEYPLLSPAEKYDRLVTDADYTLTLASWREGHTYNEQFGDVERWMGLCHGWAPASYMEPRPTHAIELDGFGSAEKFNFRPNDLKALFTLKWATGVNITKDFTRNATRFLGGRCNEKKAAQDEESGRLLAPECFDLNPGTWHLAVVNQLYQEKLPLIIDASFDYEVWNQPVVSYRYMYFNPKTLVRTQNIEDAVIDYADPEFKDQFEKFRKNPEAKKLVGIIMDISYVVENNALDVEADDVTADSHQAARYHYDLELDAEGKILGGEWYQNKHPDFIWMPSKDSIVLNNEDTKIRSFEDVPRVAKQASRNKAPLHIVLEAMRAKFRAPVVEESQEGADLVQ